MKQRVKLPVNPKQLVDLAKQVQQKHVADGNASPLNVLDWQVAGPLIDKVFEDHTRAEQLRRDMLLAYQQRNQNMAELTDIVRGCRDVLAGKYVRKMRNLGQWGFNVHDVRSGAQEPLPDAAKDNAK